jgi:diguanylate cyclase (GGDEF)-like protein
VPDLPPIEGSSSHELTAALDGAVREHLDWLKSWHRALLCGDADTIAALATEDDLGQFGTWFLRNRHRGLINQPAIAALDRLRREIRERGRAIALRAVAGSSLSAADYEAMMDAAAAFVGQVRRLERAFVAASSDLDPLTGVLTRAAMVRELDRERARVMRTGRPCCIGLADIDRFKAINDTHGHPFGDQMLTAVADCFLSGLRAYDSVSRHGGDEFLFCLPEADIKVATQILERILDGLHARPVPAVDGTEITISCSFGVAAMEGEVALDQIVGRADAALYAAKRAGRSRVCAWPVSDAAGNAPRAAS